MIMNKLRFLNGNTLKILACIAMVIDHVGLLFFPSNFLFRKIGRLALPLFAFLLAEGCKHTRNKKKHFLLLLFFATVCQCVYDVFARLNGDEIYVCILVTLLCAELCIFALQYFKRALFRTDNSVYDKILAFAPFLCAVGAAAFLCKIQTVDYGFAGCMLPVIISLSDFKGVANNEKQEKLFAKIDTDFSRFICFACGLLFLYFMTPPTLLPKEYMFLALIPVAFYNNQRGKWNLKYFFYFFYPLHLVALEGIYTLLMH